MTDALTDREKALVEAARDFLDGDYDYKSQLLARERFKTALCAYDPPKEKVYVLPTWEEFAKTSNQFAPSRQECFVGDEWVDIAAYNAIREATAKEQE